MSGRIITFIDGTNLLVQLAKSIQVPFRADNPPDSAIALASKYINSLHSSITRRAGNVAYAKFVHDWQVIRRYWYGSYKNETAYDRVVDALKSSEYDPCLFKMSGDREKGVDIALTKDMLVHAFNRNFDVAILVAGDEDYVQLIQEAKRYGGIIHIAFFDQGLSIRLKRAADYCSILNQFFSDSDDIDKFKVKINKELQTR